MLFSIYSYFGWLYELDSLVGIASLISLILAFYLSTISKSLVVFTLLILFFSVKVYIDLPYVPNHRYLICFVNAFIIISLIRDKLSDQDYGTTFLSQTRSYIPLLLSIVYLFAFFAKLNTSYLSPLESCSIVFYENIVDLLRFFPTKERVESLVIYGSLVVELLIPVLLLVPRARYFGVCLGLLFHFVLSLDLVSYFINFSAPMSVLLLSCLSVDSVKEKESHIRDSAIFALASLVVFCGVADEFEFFSSEIWSSLWALFVLFLWLLFIIPLLFKVFRSDNERLRFRWRLAESALLALVLLNGFSPYLGIKTRTSFNMYSNMRLEADYSNHLVVPKSLDLFGYLSDSVLLSSDKQIVCLGNLKANTRYPYIEVVRASRSCLKERIEILRNDRPEKIDHQYELNWIERKFLLFRPLGKPSQNSCIW